MEIHCCIFSILLVIASLSSVHTQAPSRVWSCNFEGNSSCGAILQAVGKNVRFEFMTGPTPSDLTGPLYDNTMKAAGGVYIYLEATDRQEGDQALMDTPELLPKGQPKCLEFYYHMFSGSGDHQGTLRVETQPGDNIIFRVSGSQSTEWKLVRLDLNSSVEQLVFRAIRGVRYQSDIALDDIFITTGGCKVGGPPPQGQGLFPGAEVPNEAGPNSGSGPAGPDLEIPHFDPPGPVGPAVPPSPPPRAEQGAGDNPPIQADIPEIFDPQQRPIFPPVKPPVWPSDPRAQSFEARLVSGRDRLQGRLEVFINGSWGTVCSDGWTQLESYAACRLLNFSGGEMVPSPESARLVSSDPTPIWLDGVRCSPGSVLDRCCHNEVGLHDCDHSQDVYLNCGAPVEAGKPGTCPVLPPGTVGTCVEACSSDTDCPLDQKCCSNGCGHVCTAPAVTPTPCRPGSTDCRPVPCNPQIQVCLPEPPQDPDPPGPVRPPGLIPEPPQERTPSATNPDTSGEQARPSGNPRPPPRPIGPDAPPQESIIIGPKSDFNLGSPQYNGLNFTNDGNFDHRFLVVEEAGTISPNYWMELYTQNGRAYARLKSRPVSVSSDGRGCLGYLVLTSINTTWIISISNRLGTKSIATGTGVARPVAEAILTPIEPQRITIEPFNIVIEAWVVNREDLFSIDDIVFYSRPCPPSPA